MYEKFFGFRRRPFDLVPDPDFLFLGESHDSALANLLLGIESGKGFIVIAGRVGTGKTTILRAVLRRLGRELDVAVLTQPDLDPAELLRTILGEFGVDALDQDKVALRKTLRDFLQKRPRPAILAIDEAHLLSEQSLEQVRLLSNFEEADRKLLQIVLAGQPELKESLSRARLRPLAQRIEMFYEIEPLSPEETSAYVLRRIQIAGQPDALVFEPGALEEIHGRTGGVPRLINVLAERSLITAYVAETKTVTRAIVREAFDDLGEVTQRVMGDPGPGSDAHPYVEPIRFARPSDRSKSQNVAEHARPRRRLERWLAGIGLGILAIAAIVSLGSHRALSSKPSGAAHVQAPSTSVALSEKDSPERTVEKLTEEKRTEETATALTDSVLVEPPVLSSTATTPATQSAEPAPKPWTTSEPDPREPVEEAETFASSNEASAERMDASERESDPEPPLVLTREIDVPVTRPEDVPLVDEASGSQDAARFAIQCGSFRDRDRAQELASRIGDPNVGRVQIVPLEMSSGTWFRVLLGDFESEAEARAKIPQVHAQDRLLILQVIRLSRPAADPPSAG